MIRITIPGEPVAKGRPRLTRGGIAYTPAKTQRWESTAKLFCASAVWGGLIDYPVRVVIDAYFGVPSSWPKWKREMAELENVWHTSTPDADNCQKAALDALNGTVLRDDSLVCSATVHKRYSDTPRVEITITPIDAPHTKSRRADVARLG